MSARGPLSATALAHPKNVILFRRDRNRNEHDWSRIQSYLQPDSVR
jgi:hypothetical protein